MLFLRCKKKRKTVGEVVGMATRRAVGVGRALVSQPAWAAVARRMDGAGGVPRYFGDKASGRVLSEEERAAENVYIQVTAASFINN